MTEVELERLVVRLVGDTSQYKASLDSAVKDAQTAVARIQQTKVDNVGQQRFMKEQSRMMAEADSITRSVMPAAVAYRQEIDKLSEHLHAGRISYDTYVEATGRAKQALMSMPTATQQAAAALGGFGGQLAMVGGAVTALAGGITTMGLVSAARFEQTEIAFSTMMGSAQEATALLSKLTDFAAKTPFEMPEIEQAARGLVQFGERGDQLMDTLKTLGNAAAGTSTDFGMVALIFNQIRGVGRLLTQDFRQLSTRGILSLEDIAKHFGVTTQAAQGMLSAGKVTFEDVRSILQGLSAEGGRFNNMLEKQSESLLGKWSTLKDDIRLVGRAMGETLVPIVKEVLGWLIKLADWFREADPAIKGLAGAAFGLATALGAVTLATGLSMVAGAKVVTMWVGLKTAYVAATVALRGYSAAAMAARAAKLALNAALAAGAFAVGKAIGNFIGDKLFGPRDLDAKIEKSHELNKAMQDIRTTERQATMDKAAGMDPAARQKFLTGALSEAKKELDGVNYHLKLQENNVKDLEPTWRSLWQGGRETWRAQNDELSQTGEKMVQTKQHVADLEAELKKIAAETDGSAQAMAKAQKEAEKYLDKIRDQAATFGMTEGEIKAYEASLAGVNKEVTEAIRLESEALASMEAEKTAKEEAEEKTYKLADSVRDYTQTLRDQIGQLKASAESMEVIKLKRDGATAAQLKEIKVLERELSGKKSVNKALEDGKRLMEQYATPQEKFNKKIGDLNRILQVTGDTFKATYLRAVKEAEDELAKANLTAKVEFKVEGNDAVRKGTAEFYKLLAGIDSETAVKVPQAKEKARRRPNRQAMGAIDLGGEEASPAGGWGKQAVTLLESIRDSVATTADKDPVEIGAAEFKG